VGTTNGLALRVNGRFTVIDTAGGLPAQRVNAVLKARDGVVWAGTPAGILRIAPHGTGLRQRRVFPITEANGLGHNDVRSLYQDRSGAIWAGTTFGGVSKFVSTVLVHVTERDGLRSRIVSAIHRTPDSTLWFGTYGGGVARYDGQVLRTMGPSEGLADPFVRTLWSAPTGELVVGTEHSGIFLLEGGRFKRIAPLLEGRVNTIMGDDEGRIWIGGERGVACDPGDRKGLAVGPSIHVQAIVPAGDTIWVGTDSGLYVIDTRRIPWDLRPLATVPRTPITSMARDALGNLWIGTHGSGLMRLQGRTFKGYSTADKLSSPYVEQVLLDAYQNVWIGTRQGVDMLEFDPLQEELLDVDHYGRDEGLLGIETFRNACYLDLDSALWFGTVRGATRIDPTLNERDENEPITRITGLQLFYQYVDWSPWSTGLDSLSGLPIDLVLPHDRNHLTFDFVGISLAYPEKVRYQFMLEGHDPEMSPITATERITYSNLAPGTYVFKVIARNASGIWNQQPTEFRFTIKPPVYRTWPFLTGCALLVLAGFWGFVQLRTRRLRRQSERLERMVDERTQELAAEKERSEELLLNILPEEVAEELKENGRAAAHRHEHCTVLFSDFKGFTTFSTAMDSDTLVGELHHYFGLFDALCDRLGLEKIKTIGDAYMCAAGIPQPNKAHALDAVLMAFGMVDAVERSNAERRAKGLQEWPIRIGLHTGPLIAGVVGTRKFAYDIWGDTVNLASRMESNGEAGMVNISGPLYAQLIDLVEVQPRGPIKVKGKGEVQMYFALRLKPQYSADAAGHVPNEALLALRERMRGTV
jgi:class 3 adenylate cyclase/streptogramin lyase